MALLAAVALAAATALPAASATPQAAKDGWLIAAFPLEDLAPAEETKGLGEEIAATLTDGFARSGKVRVVERKRLQTIMEEIKLSASGLVDERTAIQAGRLLGANALVLGSFLKFGDSVRINVRVVKTETGEIISTERAAGKFSALFDLAEKLAAGILPRLDSPNP
ncbi:MAG: FlgO family outer membrane protein [Smithellaceae bacterium]|nr:FlgO family outer membrane protein [Smithellaceae bacterium]